MFELAPFYRTLFYLAAALLGVQVTYALSVIHSPAAGWLFYWSFVALSVSIPMLLGACLAALFGYLKALRTLLIFGGLFAALWFTLVLMNYSVLAGILFAVVGLTCFKMLQYEYKDSKQQN